MCREHVSNNMRKYRGFSRGGKLSGLENWFAELDPEAGLVFRCVVNMCIGGALAIYVRELYKRVGSTIMNREDFSNVFPMLTLITVVIIYVVKSSLTLSLGLVGALSIVRFRTAIKSAEELAYLFLCIAIGLGLGADRRLLTFTAVIVISAFIVARYYLGGRRTAHNLLLTVTGDTKRFFEEERQVVELIEELAGKVSVQRLSLEDGQVQFRAAVSLTTPKETTALVSELHRKLPQFQVAYINVDPLV